MVQVSSTFILFFALFLTYGSLCLAQTETGSANSGQTQGSPTYRLLGEAELQSHFIHHGLSQTNKDPSLQGLFWFNFGPQFRLGVWGSNTNYEGSDIHLWLRFSADVKVDFSTTADLKIRYSQNQFYKSDSRNGSTVGLDLGLFTYHIIYEIESNWDGTNTGSSYYAFQKSIDVFGSWKWNNQVGYTMVKADAYSNFFDFRTGIGTQIKDIFVEVVATDTSIPSQFNERGDLFFLLSVKAQF